jgi:hypothetical protein
MCELLYFVAVENEVNVVQNLKYLFNRDEYKSKLNIELISEFTKGNDPSRVKLLFDTFNKLILKDLSYIVLEYYGSQSSFIIEFNNIVSKQIYFDREYVVILRDFYKNAIFKVTLSNISNKLTFGKIISFKNQNMSIRDLVCEVIKKAENTMD